MKLRVILVLTAPAILVLSGCGSGVRFVSMDDAVYAPKPKDAPVDIHDRGCPKPHVVMGTLTTQRKMKASFGGRSVYDDALAALKTKARKLGADGLMQVSPRVLGEGMGTQVEVQATAIRYLVHDSTVTSTRAGTEPGP